MLIEKSIFCSGCHMLRSSAFLDTNPSQYLYPSRGGQNWQMLLPVSFKYKRAFLDLPLYNYIIYEDSHSHSVNTLEKSLAYRANHEAILINTLRAINMDDRQRQKYIKFIKIRYIRMRFMLGVKYKNKELTDENYGWLLKLGKATVT